MFKIVNDMSKIHSLRTLRSCRVFLLLLYSKEKQKLQEFTHTHTQNKNKNWLARRFIYFNFDRTKARIAHYFCFSHILEINFCNHFSCLLQHVFQLTIPQSDRVHLPAMQRGIYTNFIFSMSFPYTKYHNC